ncbi:MAG: hypothetical protein GY822_05130 [Deltaproteobacteria bacterium]|nr:hypothetical protein [Deltaproteobacteria bacterium]
MTLFTALLVALGFIVNPAVVNQKAPPQQVETPDPKDQDMAWWHNCP